MSARGCLFEDGLAVPSFGLRRPLQAVLVTPAGMDKVGTERLKPLLEASVGLLQHAAVGRAILHPGHARRDVRESLAGPELLRIPQVPADGLHVGDLAQEIAVVLVGLLRPADRDLIGRAGMLDDVHDASEDPEQHAEAGEIKKAFEEDMSAPYEKAFVKVAPTLQGSRSRRKRIA